LLALGADPNYRKPNGGLTPLLTAGSHHITPDPVLLKLLKLITVCNGNLAAIGVLLEHGADPALADPNGRKHFLQSPKPKLASDVCFLHEGTTPPMNALLWHQREAALFLPHSTSGRCDIEARRYYEGLTCVAIHIAAQLADAEIVRSLDSTKF
jgi:hypothetical protein